MGFTKVTRHRSAISNYVTFAESRIYIPTLFEQMFGESVDIFCDPESREFKIKTPGDTPVSAASNKSGKQISLKRFTQTPLAEMPKGKYYYDKATKTFKHENG
jgi:hypothetical protein